MPLVSPVGRKTIRSRLAMTLIYCALILGGATMVYPFMMMMATAMKGPTDQNDNRLIPAYWSDDGELFRKYVDDKYGGQLESVARFYGMAGAIKLLSSAQTEEAVEVTPLEEAEYRRFERFLMSLPADEWEAGFRIGPGRISSQLALRYQAWLRRKYGSIEAVNDAYVEQNVMFQTVQPPAERFTSTLWAPSGDAKWNDWLEFKRALPAHYRIPVTVRGQWQQYLKDAYNNQIGMVPEDIRGDAAEFEDILPAPDHPKFEMFLSERLPERYWSVNPDLRWHESTGEAILPMAGYEATYVTKNAGELRKEYSARNYRFILDYVLIHGRAVWNTVIFCILAVLTTLIVNPLAAYALSRFSLPSAGKILLFLLATMAFPAEVTMIPGFLLLRDLGLLNTFAALVLPTAASGYSIYLLKGFFDSLPKDLYESASMEGAGEGTMFFRITLPMSKPVLAVIGLMSFMAAYGAFMFAFLVAQDERMWTLMVWIYQLQARAPKSTLMAALVLAAVPTLIVFLAAQRVILRGIILPGEK